MSSRAMGAREWALLILPSLVWGGSFFFAEVALRDLPPLTIVLGRVGIASLVLLAVVILAGHAMPGAARAWGAFLVMGALNNALPFSLIVRGQVHMDSGVASILNATTALAYLLYFRILRAAGATNLMLVTFLIPVSALLLGGLILGERLEWRALAGMGLIFGGLACVDGRALRVLRPARARCPARRSNDPARP